MSSKNNGGVQEGALVKMLERQRLQKAAADAAKKLEDATKEAEEIARAAAAHARRSTGQSERLDRHGGLVGPLPAALRVCI
jgi:hypothetical protein